MTRAEEVVAKLTCARNLAEAVGQRLIKDVIDEALALLLEKRDA